MDKARLFRPKPRLKTEEQVLVNFERDVELMARVIRHFSKDFHITTPTMSYQKQKFVNFCFTSKKTKEKYEVYLVLNRGNQIYLETWETVPIRKGWAVDTSAEFVLIYTDNKVLQISSETIKTAVAFQWENAPTQKIPHSQGYAEGLLVPYGEIAILSRVIKL
jgi:hypothetical protein